jgi:glycosyltransferase involved in cell wall biosynthesis
MDYVVICGHNEENNMTPVLQEMKDYNLILVDNASTDRTLEIMREYSDHVIFTTELGKAKALRAGFAYALNAGAKNVLTMDADGEHAADDMKGLLETHKGKGYDFTFGSRFNGKTPLKDQIVAATIEKLTGSSPRDPRCGGRVYSMDTLSGLLPSTVAENYGLETELCYLAFMRNVSVDFVDVTMKDARDRILLLNEDLPGELKGTMAELVDLYRVFGRGDVELGKYIMGAHQELQEAFSVGTEFFGDTLELVVNQ